MRGASYSAFEGAEGFIAYVDTGLAWVVAGDPIAPPHARVALAEAFCAEARRRCRVACFVATEAAFEAEARREGFRSLLIGEQAIFLPSRWEETLRAHRSLREQRRRARAKGVRIRRITHDTLERDPRLRRALEALRDAWLARRRMAPMGFLVGLDSLEALDAEVGFVAERDGVPIGYLAVQPVRARRGWLFEHLLRDPRAPNGTVELLFDAGMREAEREGVVYVTLGLAALSGDVSPLLHRLARRTRFLYDFAGLRRFKEKLGPSAWEPVYLTHPARHTLVVAVLAMLHAFARGSFIRFGLRSLARHPRLCLALAAIAISLAALTLALARR